MINLNYSSQPEYDLYNSLTEEVINGYGILTKYIVTEKININESTFAEWTSLKADQNDVYEVFLLPSTEENYQGQNIMFNQFGLGNFSTMDYYISESNLHQIFPDFESSVGLNDMISDLLLMPSGKVLEITAVEPLVEGINNLFPYSDRKNVFKITTRNYQFRQNDEINVDSITPPALTPPEEESQEHLNDYFNKLLDSDVIPDENYSSKNGETKILDYNMNISDILFIVDSLTINGMDSGSTPIQSAENIKITESSSSIKHKQDKKSTTPKAEKRKIVEKENQYKNPFGELG